MRDILHEKIAQLCGDIFTKVSHETHETHETHEIMGIDFENFEKDKIHMLNFKHIKR